MTSATLASSSSVTQTACADFSEESLGFFRSLLNGRRTKNRGWTLADIAPKSETSSSEDKKRRNNFTKLLGLGSSSSSNQKASKSGSVIVPASRAHSAPQLGSLAQKPPTPPLWLPLVDRLCRTIEEHGKSRLGIFRLSGDSTDVDELMQACGSIVAQKAQEGEDMEKLFRSSLVSDVHVVASVLKAYLREQQEPILPNKLYDPFLAAAECAELPERLRQLKSLITQINEDHMAILSRVMQTLVEVAKLSDENKMNASNLAIVFGPTLMRTEAIGLDIIFKIRAQCLVIENFILHHSILFLNQEEGLRNMETLPTITNTADGEEDEEDDLSPEKLALEMEQAEKENMDSQEETTAPNTEDVSAETQLGDHSFKRVAFNPFSPTMCKYCRKFIFGIRKAYMCQDCSYPAHGKCKKKAGKTCPGKHDSGKKKETKSVAVGDKAPLFTLLDGDEKPYSLEESIRLGKKIVLFFYPKDFTPGCVRENKAFRDQFSLFHYADCEIVGISGDSSSCHARFAAKYNIPFRLLSDADNKVRELYGVPDSVGGLAPGRVTYIIDPTGTVVHLYSSIFNPKEHLVHSLLAISEMLLQHNQM